ncbi:Histone-lysine n-methyltransferase, partial [Thalictrum thalictroides]
MYHEAKKSLLRFATKEQAEQPTHFFECAELILSWLSPSELALISSTCKTFYQISKSITTIRSSDASRNLENHPIPFINTCDSLPYSYFIYTPTQILGLPSPHSSQQWGQLVQSHLQNKISDLFETPILYPKPTIISSLRVGNGYGCVCKDCLDGESDVETQCPCSRLKPKFLTGLVLDSEVMTECGPTCVCDFGCANRLTQQGVIVRLRIVRQSRKGWGLYAAEFIQRGKFICEYAGELLTTAEARMRQQTYDQYAAEGQFSSALLVVREHLPSGNACLRINIDATRIGNIARFINHSCDGGNLLTLLVRNAGALFPRLCFFASRDILEGEELAFSYGDTRLRSNDSLVTVSVWNKNHLWQPADHYEFCGHRTMEISSSS